MGKTFWSLYAPIYEKVMQPDKALYDLLYEKIPPVVQGKRVLKPDGVLIAPNFVEHTANAKSTVWTRLLEVAGVKFEHTWTAEEYRAFLEKNGWTVTEFEVKRARMSIAYTESRRNKSSLNAHRQDGSCRKQKLTFS